MKFQSDTPTAGLALAPRRPGGPAGRPRRRPTGRSPTAARTSRHTTILRDQGRDRQGRRRAVRAAGRQAGRQPAGGLHRHRHPGRQHQPERQPVLGQVRDQRARRRAPAGDPQDRHQQRRQGPQRLRLHRAADRRRPRRRRVRPRGRRLERQLATTRLVSTAGAAALLDRRHDLRLAGLPERGHRRSGRSTTSSDRPTASTKVKIDPFTGAASRGPAARRSTRWFIDGTEPKAAIPAGHLRRRDVLESSASRRTTRSWLKAATATGSAGPGRDRAPGRRQRDPDRVLLQRRVPAVRQLLGRRRGPRLPGHPARAVVHPAPHARRERPDPVVRDPDAGSVGLGHRRGPLPATVGGRVRLAVGGAVCATDRDPDPGAHGAAGTDTDPNPSAHPDTPTTADGPAVRSAGGARTIPAALTRRTSNEGRPCEST